MDSLAIFTLRLSAWGAILVGSLWIGIALTTSPGLAALIALGMVATFGALGSLASIAANIQRQTKPGGMPLPGLNPMERQMEEWRRQHPDE